MNSRGTRQRGIALMDLAVVLCTTMFIATFVISLVIVNSVDFWSIIAHLRI